MKIVIVSGYFNPIHPGHLDLISEAKKLGDFLVIIVNSDDQVRQKASIPFMDEDARLRIVSDLKDVNMAFVAVDEDTCVTKSIDLINSYFPTFPMVFANGGDRNQSTHTSNEIRYCKDNDIELAYGVGGNNKPYSSSKLISGASVAYRAYCGK